jgi:hypothetical protein
MRALLVAIAGLVALGHCTSVGVHEQVVLGGPGVDSSGITNLPPGIELIYPAHGPRVGEQMQLGATGTILEDRTGPVQTNLSFVLMYPDGVKNTTSTSSNLRHPCQGMLQDRARSGLWWMKASVSQPGRWHLFHANDCIRAHDSPVDTQQHGTIPS